MRAYSEISQTGFPRSPRRVRGLLIHLRNSRAQFNEARNSGRKEDQPGEMPMICVPVGTPIGR
jgi:hypothetical protein